MKKKATSPARNRKSATVKPPQSISLTFDLFDLPTAQHKAGLAGLVLQIRSMQDRHLPSDCVPLIENLTATSATIRFTETSVQGLFDDFYDAQVVEVAVANKWPDTPPKDVKETAEADSETGRVKTVKRFIYDVVQPCGHFLAQHYPDGGDHWLKLWRDMLWAIPRSKPTTRIPFKSRAQGEPCPEGPANWKELAAFARDLAKNVLRTCPVAGALLLGAQAVNAESIPFRGRSDQTLLLHFWPLTVMIFVPQQIDNEGNGDFVGYTLAIPEVSDLEYFCDLYPRMLQGLSSKAKGYRPEASVIDIPQQAGLEFIENLALLAGIAAEKAAITNAIASVEYLHLVKAGNNTKVMASGRIAADARLLDEYLALLGRDRARFRNPLFRSGLMLALLDRSCWYQPMAAMLTQRPWPFFVRSEKTPKGIAWFAADAAKRFQDLSQKYDSEVREMNDAETRPKSPLELLVYRLIRKYVRCKTKDKCGLEWDDFKDKKVVDEKTGKSRPDVPQEYRDTREKIASDAFLAMRSRREQDFVEYFTATVCSVGQFLPEDDFRIVAEALLREPENVKTLTLLALSANSV